MARDTKACARNPCRGGESAAGAFHDEVAGPVATGSAQAPRGHRAECRIGLLFRKQRRCEGGFRDKPGSRGTVLTAAWGRGAPRPSPGANWTRNWSGIASARPSRRATLAARYIPIEHEMPPQARTPRKAAFIRTDRKSTRL